MVDRVTLIPSEGDTAEPDTGSVDTGTVDSGELDSGDPTPTDAGDDTGADEDEKASGCSCAVSDSGPMSWLALPVLGLMLARRRRA